jgi:two-component system response regulator HydG
LARTAFILIVVGDEPAGEALREQLREQAGHSCRVVDNLAEARESIESRTPDVVVAEAALDGQATAPELAPLLDRLAPDASLLIIGDSPRPAQHKRIELLILPPRDNLEQLVEPIRRAAEKAVGRREDRLLAETVADRPVPHFEGIVGESVAMRNIIERIRKAARNKLTVLILGETGTGKDLIAEAIHKRSDRAGKPFLPLNCAGLNDNLLESQLFGHVKGAFTGAVSDRKGYFEAADGGTLFLDEIGDMPLNMQAKLLRTLERREITPVGSTEIRRVDVRLIAATNVDLYQKVEESAFREDLYYRLNQWVIRVPPLRERRTDIPLLAIHLLRRANELHGTRVTGFSNEALEKLTEYAWPGNVRELMNLIESLAVEVEDRQINATDLPPRILGPRDIVPAAAGNMVGLTMAQVERMMIERTLQATQGNREQAAKMLDIGTRTLYRKLKEYDLQ